MDRLTPLLAIMFVVVGCTPVDAELAPDANPDAYVWAVGVERPDPGEPGLDDQNPRQADTLRIVEEATVLAAVVQTTGLVARFAPDHLIRATEYDLVLVLDPDRPESARFSGQIPVEPLVVDDPEYRSELEGRLLELGVLDAPYDDMSEDDREDVRSAMLAEGQLHAEAHPSIEVELVGVDSADDNAFPWVVTVALTVRGSRVEEPLRARMEHEDDRIRIEAFGPFRFSDLGIEPYSAVLGAVRNRDEFHLYLDLVAESAGASGARSIRRLPD